MTFTINPNFREIAKEILQAQENINRADIWAGLCMHYRFMEEFKCTSFERDHHPIWKKMRRINRVYSSPEMRITSIADQMCKGKKA